METVSEQFNRVEGQFEIDLSTQHHFASGVYAKQMLLPKGYKALSHAHKYDHLSILAKGTALIRTDEGFQVYSAPMCITIKAGLHHSIESLEDVVWFCVHSTEETDPKKVDEVLISKVNNEV